jgi:uncharacterized protein (DUF1778 family)
MPRISTAPKHNVCLQVKVTPEQAKAVIRAATQAEQSVSSFLRELTMAQIPVEPKTSQCELETA